MQESKSQWEKMKTANAASIIIILFCALFLVALLFLEVPNNNKDIVNFLSGTFFGSCLSAVMFFLFNYKKKENKSDTED